ncbi:negative elongation factor A-like isoform X2 [Hydractinia symbiolongicarpus]|uniref:negative elongation factor A-like isoform X2 n=1 Tax=Hydractinia symbiolongicarpus TaxID=13093 RepID=UPI00254DE0DF|nr:negative elongation factor A-like isoform X2 [Hydractinia symbiolongicarpus]
METDTSMWLCNKLDSIDNQWSSGGIATHFSNTILHNIYDCFLQLETKLKIKLLLTFLKIPLRNMEGLQDGIMAIIDLADSDPDEWVQVAANLVRDYPTHHFIDKKVGNVTASFQTTILEIHQETTDAVNQRKMSHSSNPSAGSSFVKANLKRTLSTPTGRSPHVPHQNKLIKTSTLPKKTKLLDITEQPLGVREQKKRKKNLEASLEESKQRKSSELQKSQDEGGHLHNSDIEVDAESEQTGRQQPGKPSSPPKLDQTEAPNMSQSSKVTQGTPTPSYAMLPGSNATVTSLIAPPEITPSVDTSSSNSTGKHEVPITSEEGDVSNMRASAFAVSAQNDLQGPSTSGSLVNVDQTASFTTQSLQRDLQMRVQKEHEMRIQQQQQRMQHQQHLQQSSDYSQKLFQQQQQQYSHGANITFGGPGLGLSHHMQALQAQHLAMGMHPSLPSHQKKDLSLTREQMFAAQEMFRSANKVTRTEKALILGFMAGARDNPFPQQGAVITIKLSEETETVQHHDGPQNVFIEMLFEMNYETGHWRRLKRTRVVSKQ